MQLHLKEWNRFNLITLGVIKSPQLSNSMSEVSPKAIQENVTPSNLAIKINFLDFLDLITMKWENEFENDIENCNKHTRFLNQNSENLCRDECE